MFHYSVIFIFPFIMLPSLNTSSAGFADTAVDSTVIGLGPAETVTANIDEAVARVGITEL